MAQPKQKTPPKNFLEALKELGADTLSEAKIQIKKVATDDIPQSFGLGSSGQLSLNESVSISELQASRSQGEEQAEKRFQTQLIQMREQERARLQRVETESKKQIQSLQEEIKILAKSARELGHEVEIAASQVVVNPGAYHKNFFSHLRSLIATLRQQVQDSKHWLATTNARAARRGAYWAGVSKSGTAFMLSSERYMVTSTG